MTDQPETIKIFIGTEPRMWRAEAVLRHSILKYVTGPVEIVSMDYSGSDPTWHDWSMGREPGVPALLDKTEGGEAVWYTEFTNFRWAIPEVCGFHGKAIYIDVDIVLLDDIRKLWELPVPQGKGVLSLSSEQTSVTLMDCSYFNGLADWPSLAEMKQNGWGVMHYCEVLNAQDAFSALPPQWNSLDAYTLAREEISLLHYTDMYTQIWQPHPDRLDYTRHPVPHAEAIWMDLYRDTVAAGAMPEGPPPAGELPSDFEEDPFDCFLNIYAAEKRFFDKPGHSSEILTEQVFSQENPGPHYRDVVEMHRTLLLQESTAQTAMAEKMFSGESLRPHIGRIDKLVKQLNVKTLLDYGSGKGMFYDGKMRFPDGREFTGVADLWGVAHTCYEPVYSPYSQRPGDSYDAVICVDVLQQWPEADVSWLMDDLFSHARKLVFASIPCYRSDVQLPDGENAHITVRSPDWWGRVIQQVSERYPGVRYYFILDLKIPLSEQPGDVYEKRVLMTGLPSQMRVVN